MSNLLSNYFDFKIIQLQQLNTHFNLKPMTKNILTILAVFLTCSLSAQQIRDYVLAGDKAYQTGNYYEALTRYGEAMEMDNTIPFLNFKYAEAAREFDAFRTAETAYTSVLTSKKAKDFPTAHFWLGTIQKQLGKYEAAALSFDQFLKTNPSENDLILASRKHLEDCKWAIKQLEMTNDNLTVQQLGQDINTPFSDFGAIERNDTLYYTSDRFENDVDEYTPKRHISKVLTSVKGERGEVMEHDFNKKRSHTAHTAFNTKGTKMYYTVCEYINVTDIKCAIYSRSRTNKGTWTNEQKLPEFINIPAYTHTQPSVGTSPNGKEILYFASDRPNGKGGMDIWFAFINEDGTYGQAQNVEAINTISDEITPFYDSKKHILYFSTTGYPTLGGYDIYQTQKQNREWLAPTPLATPINSSFNDIYYSVNSDGSTAYFSSNRLGSAYIEASKEACCNDIYSVELGLKMLDVDVVTLDEKNMSNLVGVKVMLNDEKGKQVDVLYNEKSNTFSFQIEPDNNYELVAKKDGFTTAKKKISSATIQSNPNQEIQLFLNQVPKESPEPLLLNALVYNENRTALSGTEVQLIEVTSNQNKNQRNPTNNDFKFELKPQTAYMLIASKAGYQSDTIMLDPSSLVDSGNIEKRFFLKKEKAPAIVPVSKVTLDGYLPLPLYFDNDQPDSNTRNTTTQKTYGQSFDAYYARKSTFKNEYGKGLTSDEKYSTDTEIEQFFENQVRTGKETLDQFTTQLLRFLEQGESVEIKVKGFASPRAKSDYNKALTKRRISSVRNHFQRWNDGALMKYINNQQLTLTEVPFGENSASSGVSDNLSDRKNSIYSTSASKERRVEIIEIRSK